MLTNYIQNKGATYELFILDFIKQNKSFDNAWLFKHTPAKYNR